MPDSTDTTQQYIDRVLAAAPPMTDETRRRIATLLMPPHVASARVEDDFASLREVRGDR